MSDSAKYERSNNSGSSTLQGISIDLVGIEENDTLVFDGTKFISQPLQSQIQLVRIVNFDGIDIIDFEYCGFWPSGSFWAFDQVAGAVNASQHPFLIKEIVCTFDDPVPEQGLNILSGFDESPSFVGTVGLVNTSNPGNPAYDYRVSDLNLEIPAGHKIAVRFTQTFFNTKSINVVANGRWVR